MRTASKTRKKKGFETYIAVLIMIVAALVIGGVLYAFMQHLISVNQPNTGLQITGLTLSAPVGSTNAYLQISVQNTGSLPLGTIAVYLNGASQTSYNPAIPTSLLPGQSFSTVCTVTGITAGNEYSVYVTATASNGATVSTPIQNVIAQS